MKELFESIKPKLPRRYLLFIAGSVWIFAGGMLLFKGIGLLSAGLYHIWIKLLIATVGGILFYLLLFSKISMKHAKRILGLKHEFPCLFSFFNFSSYGMMAVMIAGGILMRKAEVISPEYLPLFYITMGIPLFLSAIRFYNYGIRYSQLMGKLSSANES